MELETIFESTHDVVSGVRPGLRRRARSLCLLLFATATVYLGGCATQPATPPPVNDVAVRQQVLLDALGQIGRPYVYGGADAAGFDCSGLVYDVYRKVGVDLPRTAARQYDAGRHIPFADAAPGDLVFYRIDGGMHVTIYIGHGEVVQAPSSGKTVSIAHVDRPWWRDHYAGTVRVLD
ncbi:MAG TPA: C40 family peptidase [Nevskiaceae bacterium]|nr:C40 family peptidase [Nevskiaceae bacterium]